MERSERNVGDVKDMDKDAPVCTDCGRLARLMYTEAYEMWIACKADPICTACADERFKVKLRTASLARGLRVGV